MALGQDLPSLLQALGSNSKAAAVLELQPAPGVNPAQRMMSESRLKASELGENPLLGLGTELFASPARPPGHRDGFDGHSRDHSPHEVDEQQSLVVYVDLEAVEIYQVHGFLGQKQLLGSQLKSSLVIRTARGGNEKRRDSVRGSETATKKADGEAQGATGDQQPYACWPAPSGGASDPLPGPCCPPASQT